MGRDFLYIQYQLISQSNRKSYKENILTLISEIQCLCLVKVVSRLAILKTLKYYEQKE